DPARDGVDVFLALRVPDPDALALDHDAGVHGLELLVLDQVVPEVGAVGLDDFGNVVVLEGGGHRIASVSGMPGNGPAQIMPHSVARRNAAPHHNTTNTVASVGPERSRP